MSTEEMTNDVSADTTTSRDAHPDVVALTGRVLLDAATGNAIPRDVSDEALAESLTEPATGAREPSRKLHGCNFARRPDAVAGERFDARLPMYSCLEDHDFARRAMRHVKLARVHDCVIVHRGVKFGGRTAHERLVHSQVMNPACLHHVGSFPLRLTVHETLPRVGESTVRAIRGPETEWRRERLRGKLLALRDVVRRRFTPERILELRSSAGLSPPLGCGTVAPLRWLTDPPSATRVAAGVRRRWQQRPAWPRRWRPRGQHVVLLYHRIADGDETDDPGGMVVPPQLFRDHMAALRDWFDLVPAREVLAPHGRPTAAVTLDDGYLDNLVQAAPVLRELGIPATLFIVADALDPEPPEYWWDRLEHLLLEPGPGADRVRVTAGRRVLDLDLSTPVSSHRAYRELSAVLQRQGHDVALQVVATLESARPRPPACARHRRLSAEQVRALAGEGLFDIGSHTCTHSALAVLSRSAGREELSRSRQRLAYLLGEAPELLAYPYGSVGAVARRNGRDARSVGYGAAFANVAGPVEGASAFAVPRITVGRWSVDQLYAAVTAFRTPA